MVRRIDVLLVNDCEQTSRLLADGLSERFGVRVASGLRDAVDQLVRRVPDAIVCNLELPPYRGDVLLSMVAREHPEVRRILCVGEAATHDLLDVAHVTLPPGAGVAELLAAIGGED
jgi:DNA-binding NtrC family response regulator